MIQDSRPAPFSLMMAVTFCSGMLLAFNMPTRSLAADFLPVESESRDQVDEQTSETDGSVVKTARPDPEEETLLNLIDEAHKSMKLPASSGFMEYASIPTVAVYVPLTCEITEKRLREESAFIRFIDYFKRNGRFQEERKQLPHAVERMDQLNQAVSEVVTDDAFAFQPLITALLEYHTMIKAVDEWENKFSALRYIRPWRGKKYYKAGFPKLGGDCQIHSELTYFPVNGIYDTDSAIPPTLDAWAYGFWARRYYKGNMAETYLLLTMLNKLASNSFYSVHRNKNELGLLFPDHYPISSLSDPYSKIKAMYDDLNIASIPEKGKISFSGMHQTPVSIGDKAFIHTRDEVCAAVMTDIREDHDDAGGGGLSSIYYSLELNETSPCRGKTALISFVQTEADLGEHLYLKETISVEASSRLKYALIEQYPLLQAIDPELTAFTNRSGKSFYLLKASNKSHAMFTVENEQVRVVAGVTGRYGNEIGFSTVTSVTDLDANGLPEVVWSDNGRYAGYGAIVELGAWKNLKQLWSLSD